MIVLAPLKQAATRGLRLTLGPSKAHSRDGGAAIGRSADGAASYIVRLTALSRSRLRPAIFFTSPQTCTQGAEKAISRSADGAASYIVRLTALSTSRLCPAIFLTSSQTCTQGAEKAISRSADGAASYIVRLTALSRTRLRPAIFLTPCSGLHLPSGKKA